MILPGPEQLPGRFCRERTSQVRRSPRPRAIHHAAGWALVTSRVEERTVSRGSVRAVRGRGLRAGGWRDGRPRNPPPGVRILDYAGLLSFMGSIARERTGRPLLRCYWYEATVEGRRTSEHDSLADLPGLKLRLGRTRPGLREGVEGEIRRDLTTLARNNAISDALLVSAEEDLAQVVADVQDLGIRVTIVHITVGGNWTIPAASARNATTLSRLARGICGPLPSSWPDGLAGRRGALPAGRVRGPRAHQRARPGRRPARPAGAVRRIAPRPARDLHRPRGGRVPARGAARRSARHRPAPGYAASGPAGPGRPAGPAAAASAVRAHRAPVHGGRPRRAVPRAWQHSGPWRTAAECAESAGCLRTAGAAWRFRAATNPRPGPAPARRAGAAGPEGQQAMPGHRCGPAGQGRRPGQPGAPAASRPAWPVHTRPVHAGPSSARPVHGRPEPGCPSRHGRPAGHAGPAGAPQSYAPAPARCPPRKCLPTRTAAASSPWPASRMPGQGVCRPARGTPAPPAPSSPGLPDPRARGAHAQPPAAEQNPYQAPPALFRGPAQDVPSRPYQQGPYGVLPSEQMMPGQPYGQPMPPAPAGSGQNPGGAYVPPQSPYGTPQSPLPPQPPRSSPRCRKPRCRKRRCRRHPCRPRAWAARRGPAGARGCRSPTRSRPLTPRVSDSASPSPVRPRRYGWKLSWPASRACRLTWKPGSSRTRRCRSIRCCTTRPGMRCAVASGTPWSDRADSAVSEP